jgi:ATP phosphoribosyltransferase regulatory subunit
VGFSLFADAILKAAPVKPAAPRIYLPFGTEAEIAQALRAKDMITVSGLAPVTDVQKEAKRLGCQYVLTAGSPEPVAVG